MLSKLSGELVLDKLENENSFTKLAWVLSGKLLSVPKNSYLMPLTNELLSTMTRHLHFKYIHDAQP